MRRRCLSALLLLLCARAETKPALPPAPPPGDGFVRAELVAGGLSNTSAATLAGLSAAVAAAAAAADGAYEGANVTLVPTTFAAFGELQLVGVALPLVPNTQACLSQAVAAACSLPLSTLSFLPASQSGAGTTLPLYAYASSLVALPGVAADLSSLAANGTGATALLSGARNCGLDAQAAQLLSPATLSLWLDSELALQPLAANETLNGTATALALSAAGFAGPLQQQGFPPTVALAVVGVPLYNPQRPAGGGWSGQHPLYNPDQAVVQRSRVGIVVVLLGGAALVLASRLEQRALAQGRARAETQLPNRGQRAPSP